MSYQQKEPSNIESQRVEAKESQPLFREALLRPPITKTQIDWKEEICSMLGKPGNTPDDEVRTALYEAGENLQEIEQLRKQAFAQRGPLRSQIVYQVECCRDQSASGVFLDPPRIVKYGPHDAHATTSGRISNMELFLERNKEITFLVYRQYECCGKIPPEKKLLRLNDSDELNIKALMKNESIDVISPELRAAMIEVGASLKGIPIPGLSKTRAVIQSPYSWWFHRISQIQAATSLMQADTRAHIDVFARYLREHLGREWEAVRKLLERKRITIDFIHYLFVPNEVVISSSGGSDLANLEGFCLQNWATVRRPQRREDTFTIQLDAKYWHFDGEFERRKRSLILNEFPSKTEEFAITDLTIYPQKFASSETVRALWDRGKMFWKCRERHYVSVFNRSDNSLHETLQSRFMVDTKTYHEMHPSDPGPARPDNSQVDHLHPAMMAVDEPDLKDDFFMCLPTDILGFNMQRHEWVILKVADLQEVTWNESAFQHLVLEQETKDLVEAVVRNRLLVGEQTDVIQGKGNGLFLLLHGGPGTGKTLTAESVAEIAKRPLYRVTCGDIGTRAEEVEKYLQGVLMLGKTWECVVLLDEADVFLEQRQLHHLERNALVSIFLRVLEYYDGILILTSNRVGTFDEAFKSRIQLSLRYNNLGRKQRREIWGNFIERLEGLAPSSDRDREVRTSASRMHRDIDVGIDTDDIRKHLDELAGYDINGREIRNAISTARQLAMFRKVPMDYRHLLTVIREANKFQQYIKDLNQGHTADEISNDRGERYHESERIAEITKVRH